MRAALNSAARSPKTFALQANFPTVSSAAELVSTARKVPTALLSKAMRTAANVVHVARTNTTGKSGVRPALHARAATTPMQLDLSARSALLTLARRLTAECLPGALGPSAPKAALPE